MDVSKLNAVCASGPKNTCSPAFRCVWLDMNVESVHELRGRGSSQSGGRTLASFVQQPLVTLFTLWSSLQSAEAPTASQNLIPRSVLLQPDPCSTKRKLAPPPTPLAG